MPDIGIPPMRTPCPGLLGCEQQRIHHDRDEQCAERQADEPVFGHRDDGQIVGISKILPEQILSVAAVMSLD